MKINPRDFRVREGEKVSLKKWPTKVAAVYGSKEEYQRLLAEHIELAGSDEAGVAVLRVTSVGQL